MGTDWSLLGSSKGNGLLLLPLVWCPGVRISLLDPLELWAALLKDMSS